MNLDSLFSVKMLAKHDPHHDKFELAFKLHHYEFKCRCDYPDCNVTLIHPSVCDSWSLTRHDFKKKLKVNSGFRCQKHNQDVGGLETSRHLKGLAIDISFEEFTKGERELLHKILRENFDRVIQYSTFFHCHNLIGTF